MRMRALAIIAVAFAFPAIAGTSVDQMLNDAADRHGIPRDIVHAVAMVESTKRCGARNGPHRGILQVSRGAVEEVGMQWPPRSCYEEIEAGVRYLKKAIDRGGLGCKGVTLYNTGIYAKPHCSEYGRKVMRKRTEA